MSEGGYKIHEILEHGVVNISLKAQKNEVARPIRAVWRKILETNASFYRNINFKGHHLI